MRTPVRAGTLLLVALVAACADPVSPARSAAPRASGSPSSASASPAAAEPPPLSPVPLPSLQSAPTPATGGHLGELPADLRGHHWSRIPTSRKVVALTFDAGSGAEATASILDTLGKKQVAATFFLTGRWVATYPELARRIAGTPGLAIANHTMTHPDLRNFSDPAIGAELDDTERWLHSITGKPSPRPIFRFPYGAFDARTLAVVNAHGYGSVLWTADTLGWKGTSGGQSAESGYNRAVAAAQPGEIVLMHVGAAPDGTMLDAEALPRVIDELRRRGYGFVNLREFLPG